ncbi:MAG TPA: DUF1572 family protein [Gemmataceae bacterium]|jgi:hypothetical protein|nr:DUF1572 family protein [Gemmataceae bacterium]
MNLILADLTNEFRKHKTMADRAIGGLSDDAFFQRPGQAVNPIALIVKHLAGNLQSRWADFLTTDGDKPTRDRDTEFVLGPGDSRANLLAAWERGWGILLGALGELTDADLGRTITIRGEPHRVQQALLRGLSHTAYHVGQILYVKRWLKPDAAYQTIAPGQSKQHVSRYLP